MTITTPGVVVSNDTVLALIRAGAGDPKLELHAITDAEFDDTHAALTAAAPHLIRDWVDAVLKCYPYVQPGLAELADGLLPEGTP